MEFTFICSSHDRQVGKKKKQFQDSQPYPDQTYGNVLGGFCYSVAFYFYETITIVILFKITGQI